MSRFLISPPDPTEWRLSPGRFVQSLLERWPDAEVQDRAEGFYALSFKVPIRDGNVIGHFEREGQTVGLEAANYDQLAEVAGWFRAQVHADQAPIVYDPGCTWQAVVEPDSSPAQISHSVAAATAT